MIYHFGVFTFDSDRFELTDSEGQDVRLQPLTKELLHLLLQKGPGRLVSKSEIVETLWNGRQVSSAALLSQVKALRTALGDTTKPRTIVDTVHAKGWRLIPEVELQLRKSAPTVAEINPPAPSPEMVGERPSIAVLPLRIIGGSRSNGTLAEALPDDIISALSRLHLLRVIARGTSFQFGNGNIAPSKLRAALDVDYCLTGSCEPGKTALDVTVELSDTKTESVIWSEHFRMDPRAVHEVREEVVGRTVHEIERQVPRHEAERLRLIAPNDLMAWEAFHLGSSLLYRRGIANIEKAQGYFSRAVAIDPDFARAHAGLSHTYWWLLLQRALHDPGDAPELMRRSAEAAVDADPDDPAANLAMGKALSLSPQRDQAPEWLSRAIDLSPSYAMGHTQMAAHHAFAGPFETAMEHGQTALRLSPRDPMRYSTYAANAIAMFNLGDLQASAEWGRKAQSVPHEDLMIMVTALCSIFLSGEKEEAAQIADHIRGTFPGVTIAGIERANPFMGDQVRPAVQAILTANGFS